MNQVRPVASEVAKRLLILKTVVINSITAPPRDMLSEWMRQWSETERDEFRRESESRAVLLVDKMKEVKLWDDFSPREKAFCLKNMATMELEEQVDFGWRMEAATVLLWALGMIPSMPPIDQPTDYDLLKDFPENGVSRFMAEAVLRDANEIEKARDTAELWHWRSRTRYLSEEGGDPGPELAKHGFDTYDDIVRKTAAIAHEDGTIDETIDDDFAVGGKAFRDLSDEEWSQVRSVIQERHFALNWLCGYAPDNQWDDTPTDT